MCTVVCLLPTWLTPVTPRNDLRTITVLDAVFWKQPDGCLISSPAYMQVVSTDQYFVVFVGDAVWQVFRQHVAPPYSLTYIRTKQEHLSRGARGGRRGV